MKFYAERKEVELRGISWKPRKIINSNGMTKLLKKEEMNLTISCKALARISTPHTLKIEGHIKKKKVQEAKYHIEHQEINPKISCNALARITTPQTIKIEGHIKKKKVIVLIDSDSTHNYINF